MEYPCSTPGYTLGHTESSYISRDSETILDPSLFYHNIPLWLSPIRGTKITQHYTNPRTAAIMLTCKT